MDSTKIALEPANHVLMDVPNVLLLPTVPVVSHKPLRVLQAPVNVLSVLISASQPTELDSVKNVFNIVTNVQVD